MTSLSVSTGRTDDFFDRVLASWRKSAAEIHYHKLSTARRAEAREEFFKIVVQPALDENEIATARARFEQLTDADGSNRPTDTGDATDAGPGA